MLSKSFVRGVSVAGVKVLGTDADPSALSGALAVGYAALDNAASSSGINADAPPVQALVVAPTYAGAGPAPSTTASVFAWEPEAGRWFLVQAGVALVYGEETLVALPAAARGGVFAVVPTASSPPAGTYTFGIGFSYASASAAVAQSSGAGSVDGFVDFSELAAPATGDLATLLGGKFACARAFRAVAGGAVTVKTLAGTTRTRTYLAGEGYDVKIVDVVAAQPVLVFW